MFTLFFFRLIFHVKCIVSGVVSRTHLFLYATLKNGQFILHIGLSCFFFKFFIFTSFSNLCLIGFSSFWKCPHYTLKYSTRPSHVIASPPHFINKMKKNKVKTWNTEQTELMFTKLYLHIKPMHWNIFDAKKKINAGFIQMSIKNIQGINC